MKVRPTNWLAFLFGALALAGAAPVQAAECVYLVSGFTIDVDSHTENNGRYILQSNTGTLELPASDVLKVVPLVADPAVPPAAAVRTADGDVLSHAAAEQGLEAELVRSVAKIESNLHQSATSPKGAVGLMQLMPATASALGVNAASEHENAQGGAKYLRELLIRYHGDSALALAAYNAGPGAVAKFKGVPPYAETRAYVLRVLREYQKELRAKTAAQSLSAAAANKPTAID